MGRSFLSEFPISKNTIGFGLYFILEFTLEADERI
jgi:hypothetical protein